MGSMIKLDTGFLKGFVSSSDLEVLCAEADKAAKVLLERTGMGSDYLGWQDLPENMLKNGVEEISDAVSRLKNNGEILVVLGIGGSYLGARSAVEFLAPEKMGREIIFAGYHMSGTALRRLLSFLEDRDFSVNVISKSGTTIETAIAFRFLKDLLTKKYAREEVSKRVICTTSADRGALKAIAEDNSYKTLVIPDDVGGRFSVLSAVGLLAMSWCGMDIRKVLKGALAQKESGEKGDGDIAKKYASVRNILYRKGIAIEVLSSFDKDLHSIGDWWRQLFGESEGKDGKGIFPSCCNFTTDLHSMGQLLQEGRRNIFETFLILSEKNSGIILPEDKNDHDGLNYLAGRDMEDINRKAYEGTARAHFEGGLPNITIEVSGRTERDLGALFYFFERAAAISGYILGINPFDQPGVESYKHEMLQLLRKG